MTGLAEIVRRLRPSPKPFPPAGFGDGLRGLERKESRVIRLIKRIEGRRPEGPYPWLPGDPL